MFNVGVLARLRASFRKVSVVEARQVRLAMSTRCVFGDEEAEVATAGTSAAAAEEVV